MTLLTELPRDPSAWTLETIIAVATQHDFEPGAFDFKDVLIGTGPPKAQEDHRNSIRRTAASMANSDGGHIIFGVGDKKKPIEKRLAGMPINGDLRKQFGDLLRSIQPEIGFDASPKPIPTAEDPSCGYFVVYIPLSQRRPHMFEHRFYSRGKGGQADPMNVNQVRDQMVHTEERLRRIQVFRLELLMIRVSTEYLLDPERKLRNGYRIDFTLYKSLLSEISPSLLQLEDGKLIRLLLMLPVEFNKLNSSLGEYDVAFREADNMDIIGGGSVVGQGARVARVERYKKEVLEAAEHLAGLCRLTEEQLREHWGGMVGGEPEKGFYF